MRSSSQMNMETSSQKRSVFYSCCVHSLFSLCQCHDSLTASIHRMIIKLIIIITLISLHHNVTLYTMYLLYISPKTIGLTLFLQKTLKELFSHHHFFMFYQSHILIPTLCFHPSLSPNLLCACVYVIDCA